MQEPPWMPRTEEEYRQQLAEDAGPQPDEMVRLQQIIDFQEHSIVEHKTMLDQRIARVVYLERLLDRAYIWLHNPYTPSQDALLCAQFDAIKREIQVVIAHLPEKDEPPVALPCASCDGVGCPNCQAPSYQCGDCGAALNLDGSCPVAWEEAK